MPIRRTLARRNRRLDAPSELISHPPRANSLARHHAFVQCRLLHGSGRGWTSCREALNDLHSVGLPDRGRLQTGPTVRFRAATSLLRWPAEGCGFNGSAPSPGRSQSEAAMPLDGSSAAAAGRPPSSYSRSRPDTGHRGGPALVNSTPGMPRAADIRRRGCCRLAPSRGRMSAAPASEPTQPTQAGQSPGVKVDTLERRDRFSQWLAWSDGSAPSRAAPNRARYLCGPGATASRSCSFTSDAVFTLN